VGILLVIIGVGFLIESYLIATDKIKLSKSSQVFNCILLAVWIITGSLQYF
jgi:nitrate reductase gamma subunit